MSGGMDEEKGLMFVLNELPQPTPPILVSKPISVISVINSFFRSHENVILYLLCRHEGNNV